MLCLRVVTTDDWPLWRELRRAALTEAPQAFKARLADWHSGGERKWRARLEFPGTHNVVAFLDGEAVGLASGVAGDDGIDGSDGRVAELRSVWVDPKARGGGVAGELVAAVETWARQSGATTLKLAVLPDNDAAIALYRRHGFVLSGHPGVLLPDGVTRERVMEKALT
jgi:ribosomal protein S18 acetylase RimI-like enzyme